LVKTQPQVEVGIASIFASIETIFSERASRLSVVLSKPHPEAFDNIREPKD